MFTGIQTAVWIHKYKSNVTGNKEIKLNYC